MIPFPQVLAYVVEDTPYNREWFPGLIGKGFDAPPGYAAILPYRKMKTRGCTKNNTATITGIVDNPQPPAPRQYPWKKLVLP